MRRKAIVIILLSILSLTLNLAGCTNEKEALNQSIVITDDVKADTEPELKVISTEVIPLENYIKDFSNIYIENDDESTLIRQNYVNGYLMQSINIKIDGDKVISEYEESFDDEYKNISKSFYLESLGDNKALITDWRTDNEFEVEESLISNEKSRYEVSGEYLIELVNGPVINNSDSENIAWTNLKTGSGGAIKIP